MHGAVGIRVPDLEALYRAREALQETVRRQSGLSGSVRRDFPAYGSALQGTLASLNQLTGLLVEQVGEVDPERVQRDARWDHPTVRLERALAHLRQLHTMLSTAVADIEQYWSNIEHVRIDIESDTLPSE